MYLGSINSECVKIDLETGNLQEPINRITELNGSVSLNLTRWVIQRLAKESDLEPKYRFFRLRGHIFIRLRCQKYNKYVL